MGHKRQIRRQFRQKLKDSSSMLITSAQTIFTQDPTFVQEVGVSPNSKAALHEYLSYLKIDKYYDIKVQPTFPNGTIRRNATPTPWQKFQTTLTKTSHYALKALPVAISIATGGAGIEAAISPFITKIFQHLPPQISPNTQLTQEVTKILENYGDKSLELLLDLLIDQIQQETVGKIASLSLEKIRTTLRQSLEAEINPQFKHISSLIHTLQTQQHELDLILEEWMDHSEASRAYSNEQLMALADSLETRFDDIDARFTTLDGRFDKVDTDLKEIQDDVLNTFNLTRTHLQLSHIQLDTAQQSQSLLRQNQRALQAKNRDIQRLVDIFQAATPAETSSAVAANQPPYVHQNLRTYLMKKFTFTFQVHSPGDIPFDPNRFIPRQTIFAELKDWYTNLTAWAETRFFLLQGEVGVGKTWLLTYTLLDLMHNYGAIIYTVKATQNPLTQLRLLFQIPKTQAFLRHLAETMGKFVLSQHLPFIINIDGIDEVYPESRRLTLFQELKVLTEQVSAFFQQQEPEMMGALPQIALVSSIRNHAFARIKNILAEKGHPLDTWLVTATLGDFSESELPQALRTYELPPLEHMPPGFSDFYLSHRPIVIRQLATAAQLYHHLPSFSDDTLTPLTVFLLYDLVHAHPCGTGSLIHRFGVTANRIQSFLELGPQLLKGISGHQLNDRHSDLIHRLQSSRIVMEAMIGPTLVYRFIDPIRPLMHAFFQQAITTDVQDPQAIGELFRYSVLCDYHGEPIIPRDWYILHQLEELIGKSLPKVPEIDYWTFGFQITEGQIVGLGLYNQKLTKLPETIGQLTNLHELDLRFNKLTALPTTIGQLTHLHELDLRNNKLTDLPETIGQLTHLQCLDLRKNKLTDLPETIGQLTHLQRLDLRKNLLRKLPAAIAQLTHLQRLDLRKNKLTDLPETIGQLTHLQCLDLRKNKLTDLPETIGQLTHLHELDFSDNRLAALPATIGQLTHLQKLYFEVNELWAFPAAIAQLTNLKGLDLGFNLLTKLPAAIGQLTHLHTLTLWENRLTALPAAISQLTNLQKLDLSHNQLTALPATIGQLTHLQKLDLRFNKLTALPATIGQLTHLQKLDLSHNQLTKLPAAIGQLTNLTHLALGNNKLREFPAVIRQLPNLHELYLGNNKLTALPAAIGQLTNLTHLALGNNKLREFPAVIRQLTHLQRLSLFRNELTTLPAAIGQLTHLHELDLWDNQLTALPPTIGQLTKLHELDLRNNQLTALPATIGQLTHLHELDLRNNQLKSLPESITALKHLSWLLLANSNIQTISDSQLEWLQHLHTQNGCEIHIDSSIRRLFPADWKFLLLRQRSAG